MSAPGDAEAESRYAAAIREAQAVLAAWVADQEGRVSPEETANRVLAILDDRQLVALQRARGYLE